MWLNKCERSERSETKWRPRLKQNEQLTDQPRSVWRSKNSGCGKKEIREPKINRRKINSNMQHKELENSGINISHVTLLNYLRKEKKWKHLEIRKSITRLTAENWGNYILESTKYTFHFPKGQGDVGWEFNRIRY